MKKRDLTPSPFFLELEKAKTEVLAKSGEPGLPFVDLTVSSPMRVGIPFDLDLAVDAVKGEFNGWDTNPAGTLKAREAVAKYYRERGGNFTPEQILLTASTSEAYSILFKAFCDPGDVILTPLPGYPLLDTLAELEHLECAPYFLQLRRENARKFATDESRKRFGKELCGKCHPEPLGGEGSSPDEENKRFRFTLDADSLLTAPERSKILLLVSPHNPTGHCVSRTEWNEAVRFCEKNGLVLVVDEVFGDYGFSDDVKRTWEYLRRESKDKRECHPERSAAESKDPGPRCPIVWLNGLSKICGSPQVKLGWMAVYAPEDIRESVHEKLEFVADAYLSVSSMAQALAAPLLEQSAAYESKVQERIRTNWKTLRDTFPSKYCPEVLGGWYAAIRLGTDDEEMTLRLLREKHVLVQPGFFFDFEEDGWIVISLLQPPEVFTAAIQRLK